MHRRTFLRFATGAVLGSRIVSGATVSSISKPLRTNRIGCTTVSFRQRFAATRPKGMSSGGSDLTLLEVPAFFADRLGILNVEVWSKHFAEPTIVYAEKLRTAAGRSGARIINVQLDEPPFDLCASDATKRRVAVEAARHWMNVAAACGAPSLRANTGGRPNEPFVLATAVDSFRVLAEHGERLGLKVLVENHGGHSANLENVAAIVAGVNSPWCRSLPDFGNFPADLPMATRIAQLQSILPQAALVSAKGAEFDADYRHMSFDVAACVRAAERSGFQGIYSVELWASNYIASDPERAFKTIADTIERELEAVRSP